MSIPSRIQGFVRHKSAVAALWLLPGKPVAKTVFIAGTGRSGTTWLTDLVNYRKDFRVSFEPFHPQYVKQFSHFSQRQYLDPQDSEPSNTNPLNDLLQGKIGNRWVNSRVTSFFSDKLLVKDIRGNLLLPWIHHHHPETRIILLLRHPCAVILSKMKLGWGSGVNMFTEQENLVRDYLGPMMDTITSATAELEQLATAWCIENYIPLKYFKKEELLVCYYENLATDPQKEMDRIMDHIGEEKAMIPARLIRRPSDTNFNRADHSSPALIGTARWRDKFDTSQFEKVKEIMKAFGMESLYDSAGLPLRPELCR